MESSMRRTGGTLAILGGILCVVGGIGSAILAPMPEYGFVFFIGGVVMAFFIIVPAGLVMGSRGPVQPIIVIATCLIGFAFGIGGDFLRLPLLIALIGGILALFQPHPAPR